MSEDEKDETMPFTHRPWGTDEPADPFTSPSGASTQPSGPGYQPPPTPPPPMSSPPYGAPQPGPHPDAPSPWGAAPYGAAAWNQTHKGANLSMILGIVALVCLALSPFCFVTFPGVFAAPVAWTKGHRALKEIDASPETFGNRGQAQAGVAMGIIGTVLALLGLLAIVGFVALFVITASSGA